MNTLLLANATPLELALTDSTDVLTRLGPSADAIARFKSVPGDPLLPFLIWEYGLGELQPYIIDARELVLQGVLWQRLRGTPAALSALTDALALLLYDGNEAGANNVM